jgi:hypothetical protein
MCLKGRTVKRGAIPYFVFVNKQFYVDQTKGDEMD